VGAAGWCVHTRRMGFIRIVHAGRQDRVDCIPIVCIHALVETDDMQSGTYGSSMTPGLRLRVLLGTLTFFC
jgi:hypothetical protein